MFYSQEYWPWGKESSLLLPLPNQEEAPKATFETFVAVRLFVCGGLYLYCRRCTYTLDARSRLPNLAGRSRSVHPKKRLHGSRLPPQSNNATCQKYNHELHLYKSAPFPFLIPSPNLCPWSGVTSVHRAALPRFLRGAAQYGTDSLCQWRQAGGINGCTDVLFYILKALDLDDNYRVLWWSFGCPLEIAKTLDLDANCRVLWWSVQPSHWRTSTTICTAARNTFSQDSGYKNW